MLSPQTKPAFTSWLILSLTIVVAQLFNDGYEYLITSLIIGLFILELKLLTKGSITEKMAT